MQGGQRLLERRAGDPAPGVGEVRPPQPFFPLRPEEDVEPTPERVAVHEHRAVPGAGRTDGQGTREDRRPRPSPAAEHPDGRRLPSGPLDDIGDPVDEPALRVRQPQDALRSDLHGPPPHAGVALVTTHEQHARPARHPRQRAAASSPTTTSGAASHTVLRSGGPWCTTGRHPAAAHNLSRSSSSSASSLTISGSARRPSATGGRPPVPASAMSSTPLPLVRGTCPGAVPAAHRAWPARTVRAATPGV